MKILNKILILSSLCFNLFAQSTTFEPNSVKIDNDYEFKSSRVGYLYLTQFNSNFGPTMYFLNNQTNSSRGAIGSFVTTGLSNTFGMFSNSSINFATLQGNSFPSRLTIMNNGNVGINTESPTTKLEVNGFTKLGSDAPAIKLKKLTSGCTTSANSGFPSGEISLTHGITPSKILKVEALVEYATNFWVKDGNDLFGYEFDVYITNTTISLRNLSGSASSEIRSKPCKVLITYEE